MTPAAHRCTVRIWRVTFAAIALFGCHDAPTAPATELPGIRQYVTDAVAEQLDADGRFVLAAPASGAVPELTAEQAATFARLFVEQFLGAGTDPYLESDHGGRIHFDRLTPCGRPLYAASSFEPDPAATAFLERVVGPWWLIAFCDPDRPALSLAVSALATDLTIVDGQLRFPFFGGGSEFIWRGVPASWEGPVPSSPETAVLRAHLKTGARIAAVPELIAPYLGFAPQAALWRLKLEQPVPLRGARSGTVRAASEVYQGSVQPAPSAQSIVTVAIPTTDQPKAIVLQDVGPLGQPGPKRTIHRRAGIPVKFESAAAVGAVR